MVFCTSNLQSSIQQVQSFLEPTEEFTTSRKIYGPEDEDPQRDSKLEIIDFGEILIRFSEKVIRACRIYPLSHVTFSKLHADAEKYRSRELPEISGAEYPEFSEFCAAIAQLIENCCAATSLETLQPTNI